MSRGPQAPVRRPAAIVSRASSAIGEAIAIELAARGYPVAVGVQRVDLLDNLVGRIRRDGGEAVCLQLDVTDQQSVDRFVVQATDAIGDIEILVNGADDVSRDDVHGIGTDLFEDQVQIYLTGAHRIARAVLPAMVARKRGDVVFIGHDIAMHQRMRLGVHGAAKAGLAAMVTNLRMELAETGVRASIVHPGRIWTATGTQKCDEVSKAMLTDRESWDLTRHGSGLQAGDIARVVAFVIETPHGSNVVSVEVQPEAPVA